MAQPTLIRFFERFGYKIYGPNKTEQNWPDPFWLVAHVGLVRIDPINPIGPKSLFNLFK